jgi:hypothetical protein
LPSLLSELRSHTSSLAEGEERGDLILHIHPAPLSLEIALLGEVSPCYREEMRGREEEGKEGRSSTGKRR